MTSTHSIPTVEQLQAELARVKAESSEAIRSRDRKITALREQAQRATEVERERCAKVVANHIANRSEQRASLEEDSFWIGATFVVGCLASEIGALESVMRDIESGETA